MRPSLAERIAAFETANNAPHGTILLVAGIIVGIETLADRLRQGLGSQRPSRPRIRWPRDRSGGRGES